MAPRLRTTSLMEVMLVHFMALNALLYKILCVSIGDLLQSGFSW